MKILLSLIGLLLVLEGLPYVAFPEAMQKWMRQLSETAPPILRIIGLASMAIGLLLCYLAQRTGLFH